MEQRILDFDDNIAQSIIRELPDEVRTVLSRIFDDMREGITQGKAPVDNGNDYSGWINYIPSKHKGPCCPVLVAVCYDKDNFETRMLDCLDHASINCVGINHKIFFITTQWNSHCINRHKGYIDSLKRNGLLIKMIYVTSAGIALMPV